MEECPNKQKNFEQCSCSADDCDRKGICCECVAYHRSEGQLPACMKK